MMIAPQSEAPLLMAVEGIYDIHFLKVISTMLQQTQLDLPNLAHLEANRQILFLPTGGSNLKDWVERIGLLHKREFHLYDREEEPETSERRKVIALVNRRPGCIGVLTRKRALENYLHPLAILEACGIELSPADDSDVPGLLVKELLKRRTQPHISSRGQKHLREKVKKILNLKAVERMTPELLAEQDPAHELTGWLRMIARQVKELLHG